MGASLPQYERQLEFPFVEELDLHNQQGSIRPHTTQEAHVIGYQVGFESTIGPAFTEEELTGLTEDELVEKAVQTEVKQRQNSPFEFFAHDLNRASNSEELWEAYDEGVSQGVRAGVRFRLGLE